MVYVDIKIDSHCMGEPSIHDGLLKGIQLEDDKTCRLTFQNSSGNRVELILTNVKHFRADELLEGNIVGEWFLFRGKEIPIANLEHLIYGNQHAAPSHLETLYKKYTDGQFVFFQLEPSYGCKIQALCGGIQCRRSIDESGPV